MSLIVETGLIVSGAESYVSVSDCDTYHSNRGNTTWTGTAAVKEAALRNATTYIDGKYRPRWKGCKVRPIPTDAAIEQPLEWPRYDVQLPGYTANGLSTRNYLAGWVFPFNQIPQKVKDATCEAALRALSGPLAIDADASVRRKKIDVLETEYAPGAVPGQVTYQVIDQLLSDYLKPANSCDAIRG